MGVRDQAVAHFLMKDGIVASSASFVAMVCEQMRAAGDISTRKMFGEYAIYCGGKVVAFVCDDQLFVKPTPAGRVLLGSPTEAPPYPGAQPYFLIIDELDDGERLARLVTATAQALPAPRPETSRGASRAGGQ
jgi:TfoX/Sxy family transcriptional regulator of competence genes